jgi:hypothetical protein
LPCSPIQVGHDAYFSIGQIRLSEPATITDARLLPPSSAAGTAAATPVATYLETRHAGAIAGQPWVPGVGIPRPFSGVPKGQNFFDYLGLRRIGHVPVDSGQPVAVALVLRGRHNGVTSYPGLSLTLTAHDHAQTTRIPVQLKVSVSHRRLGTCR